MAVEAAGEIGHQSHSNIRDVAKNSMQTTRSLVDLNGKHEGMKWTVLAIIAQGTKSFSMILRLCMGKVGCFPHSNFFRGGTSL